MSEISIANLDQREFWNEQKGDLWVRLQPRIDAMLAPFGEKAIATLAPAPGDSVLEIGCGTGATTLALAGRIRPTGRILAVDISGPMLRTAVARAAGTSAPEIAFVEADAQVHDFAPGGFDAAYSRFGMMFFADPVAAFRNILGAVRPGGRLAYVCWADRADNPWVRVPAGAARQYLELPAPPPDDLPGQFSMANGDRVRAILHDAGWSGIRLERFDIEHSIGLDVADAASFACQMGPMAEPFTQADDATKRNVTDAIREALEPHAGPHGVRLGFSTWIVSATRP